MNTNFISLSKGQNVSLSKLSDNVLDNIIIGLGWQSNNYSGQDFDLDASVFMLNSNEKCPSNNEFIFYNQLEHISKSVIHTGDNKIGGDGNNDDEQIKIKLSNVPVNIEQLMFVVTIHDAQKRKQSFGHVNKAYIRLVDETNNSELARYDLVEDSSTDTAMIFGKLYRYEKDWKFKAIGQGYANGLTGFCESFGISVG